MSIKYNLCCPYILDIWPSTGVGSIPGNSLKENLLSLSQQLSIVSSSSAKDGTLCPPPLFMSGLSLSDSYAFCHSCWVFICSSPLLCLNEYKASGLYSFCLLFCNDSEPWKEGIWYDIYDPPRAELSAPLPGVGFCTSHQLLQREVSLLQVRRCTDFGSNIDVIVLNRLPMTYYYIHSFVQFNTMLI